MRFDWQWLSAVLDSTSCSFFSSCALSFKVFHGNMEQKFRHCFKRILHKIKTLFLDNFVCCKVQLFWEGHKNLCDLPYCFEIYLVNNICANFCGLLLKAELYQNCSDLLWERIVQVIEKNFWNLRLKAKNLQNFWDH